MSAGFEARIAEVLREHRKSWYLQSGVATCLGCDWSKFGTAKVTGDLHTAHAASVVAALFTQETVDSFDFGSSTRWVSGWEQS